MRHYQVRDVMTASPMTVTPSTPIKEVASMLATSLIGVEGVTVIGLAVMTSRT